MIRPDGVGHDLTGNYRDAMIYNAFVWSQLFNEINARKIRNEINPFDGIQTNHLFLGIFVGSAFMQFITVQFAGIVFKTVPLDGDDWGVCLLLGLMSIPFGMLGRFLPPFDFMNKVSFRWSSAKVEPAGGSETTQKDEKS